MRVGLTALKTWPAWALMWSAAVAIYVVCKWLTWRSTPVCAAPLWRHVGYLFAWPGMDASAFLDRQQVPQRPRLGEWVFASTKTALGLGVLFYVCRHLPAEQPYLVGWVGMAGIVLVLHFGTFHLLSCTWRTLGVEAQPLMNWPFASRSVSEFWGRRWNRAFRDLTYRFLFRPLTRRLGPRRAILVGFGVSGLVHDGIISLPAGGGYGGPTAFFLLQGAALLVERGSQARKLGVGCGWRGRLFTVVVVAGPACLLFHSPFVENVIVPFLHALGAL